MVAEAAVEGATVECLAQEKCWSKDEKRTVRLLFDSMAVVEVLLCVWRDSPSQSSSSNWSRTVNGDASTFSILRSDDSDESDEMR